jgi:hypothetical protein
LLVLTIIFVLIGEVFIYVPSEVRDRLVFLQGRVEAARIAALSVEAAPPTGRVTEAVAQHAVATFRRPAGSPQAQ